MSLSRACPKAARGALPTLAAALLIAACGTSGPGLHTAGPKRDSKVAVTAAFPRSQRLAQRSELIVSVRNASAATIPNVAVTLTNPRYGTAAQALGLLLAPPRQGQPLLASRSRPVWIIDRAPGPCVYSCSDGGPGGAATAYADTWALGPLKPGQTARFDWHVTAIRAGSFRIRYAVAAGLDGQERAVTVGGVPATGTLDVTVSSAAPQGRVESDGAVVYAR